MVGDSYSEDAQIEQPSIRLFRSLGYEARDYFHEFKHTGRSPLKREGAPRRCGMSRARSLNRSVSRA